MIAAIAALSSPSGAQELEPRTYANAPVGVNFLVLGYSSLTGGIATDPTSPLQNADLQVHGPFLGYARAMAVAGRSAKVDVAIPFGFLSGSADFAGQPREREVSGFWDPKVRFSIALFGAPALSLREFSRYRQDWILGASVQVGVPLGQYDASRLVNLGNHRWSFRPELGLSKAIGRWTVEVAAGATFFTDNQSYLGEQTRAQEPVYSVQAHVVYTFASRIWIAVDATRYEGGVSEIDGRRSSDRLSNSRLGVTLALPIDVKNSIKLFAHSGVSVRAGADYSAFTAAWQHRWGGGLP